MTRDELIALAASLSDVNTDDRGRKEYVFDEHCIVAFGAHMAESAAPAGVPSAPKADERGSAEPVAWRYKVGKSYEYRPMKLTHFFYDEVNERYIQGEPLYTAPARDGSEPGLLRAEPQGMKTWGGEPMSSPIEDHHEALLHAGAMLSNCAFNLAQRTPGIALTADDIRALNYSRKAWDAARSSAGSKPCE